MFKLTPFTVCWLCYI